jgi:FixJ family two-component response regulator
MEGSVTRPCQLATAADGIDASHLRRLRRSEQICPLARASCYIRTIYSRREVPSDRSGAALSLSCQPRFAACRPAWRGTDASARLLPSRGALTLVEAIPTVIVVDDDPGIRESIGGLLRSVGLQAKLFASVDEFLEAGRPEGPACLVLDVRLPGRSGLDLQRGLAAAHTRLPIIFITGHGDIPMSVTAMKGGAIEFLTKPFRDQDLLDAIQLGLARDRAQLQDEKSMAALRARFETLTPREREVMALVVAGRLNKQIAYEIGVSEITVKVHRGQVMRKMGAASLPDLARMADRLNPSRAAERC